MLRAVRPVTSLMNVIVFLLRVSVVSSGSMNCYFFPYFGVMWGMVDTVVFLEGDIETMSILSGHISALTDGLLVCCSPILS